MTEPTEPTEPTVLPGDDDVFKAAVDLIGRTGATDFQLRYSDDEQPVVWMTVAGYNLDDGTKHYEATGGLTPRAAAYRLCETMIDGGTCAHCRRPSGVSDDFEGEQPMDIAICWFVYDPEKRTFRRGCEGTDTRPCALTVAQGGRSLGRCNLPEVLHVRPRVNHDYTPPRGKN